MKHRVAVFASGSGSNFQALIDMQKGGDSLYEIALLVCDRPHAPVIERAHRAGIPVFSFRAKEYPDKQAYEEVICQQLQKYQITWVVLAGYMRMIGARLLNAYGGRMINLHPSLLPAFKGKDAIKQAYEYGVRITGVTVHFVDEGMDTGPIIAQEAVPITEQDSLETLTAKIHHLEHQILPRVLNQLVAGERFNPSVIKNSTREENQHED